MRNGLENWLDARSLPGIIAAVLGVITALAVILVVGGYLLVTP
jgi:hypothetical protein